MQQQQQQFGTVLVTHRHRKSPAARTELILRHARRDQIEVIVTLGSNAWTCSAQSPAELRQVVEQVAGTIWGGGTA
jgi:hypothetical protein